MHTGTPKQTALTLAAWEAPTYFLLDPIPLKKNAGLFPPTERASGPTNGLQPAFGKSSLL